MDGWMPLHCAANSSGNLCVIKYLLEECLVQRDALIDTLHHNALHLAVSEGCLEVTKYLIEERGYDMTALSLGDKTPLHLACIYGHTHIAAQYLIEEALLFLNDTREEQSEAQCCMLVAKTSTGLPPYDSAISVQFLLDQHLDNPCQQDQVIAYLQSFITPLAVSGDSDAKEPAVKLDQTLVNLEQETLAKETLAIMQDNPVKEVAYHILGYLSSSFRYENIEICKFSFQRKHRPPM